MKAVVMRKYGGPDVMALDDVPAPEPRANEVLIEVHAAALNPVDWKIRAGMLKAALDIKVPAVMGSELSGVVTGAGPEVLNFAAGDAVYARVDKDAMGAMAEYCAVDAGIVAKKPESLSHVEASGVPLAGLTAWQCLFDRMAVQSGQKVLIHAGAGGVGTFAIQFAKNAGAYVATTASAANHELLRELGADECIDYTTTDFTEVLSDYDAVLDAVGGQTTLDSIKVAKPGGWVVSIASLPDPVSALEMGIGIVPRLFLRFMTRNIVSTAKAAGVHYRFLFLEPRSDQLKAIADLIDSGKVRVIVDSTYPIEEYAEAFAKLETGHARGKIVLALKPE